MSIHLYITYLSAPNESKLREIIDLVPDRVKSKIFQSHHLADRWQYALSDLLMRKMLAQELKVPLIDIQIEIDEYGKPFLRNRKRCFNISHSREIIVLTTDDTPIGVDIEYVQPLDDIDDLIKQFSQDEQRAFRSKTKEQRLDFFYDLWTLKESYVKAIGKGLNCPLDSFCVQVMDKEVKIRQSVDQESLWYFHRYSFDHRYKCAVCAKHQHFPESARVIPAPDLLSSF